jgi:hypothetical protein
LAKAGQFRYSIDGQCIIFGRFQIGMDSPTRPINLIVGAGYQVAVTSDPVVKNNWVATLRVTF